MVILDRKSIGLFVEICNRAFGQIAISEELCVFGEKNGYTLRAKNDKNEYFITSSLYKSLIKNGILNKREKENDNN